MGRRKVSSKTRCPSFGVVFGRVVGGASIEELASADSVRCIYTQYSEMSGTEVLKYDMCNAWKMNATPPATLK